MTPFVFELGFMLSAVLFIVGLKKLSHPTTARSGNLYSLFAMLLAIAITLFHKESHNIFWVCLSMILGMLIGLFFEKKTQITEMPQLIAFFNGLGGLASFLVSLGVAQKTFYFSPFMATALLFTTIVGALTFTGSLVAWGKLGAYMPSRSIVFPFHKCLNALLFFTTVLFGALYFFSTQEPLHLFLSLFCVLTLGVTLFIPVGGADMPVIISFLNSSSGLAASFAGFSLNNTLLILSGSLVGASGFILTIIMCKAMNRSLYQVLQDGFRSAKHSASTLSQTSKKTAKTLSVDSASYILESAQSIAVVPGYGLAVSQAQHLLQELSTLLKLNQTEIFYAIHPVAGRMPGHMNVLLAEANIPYEELVDLETINEKMRSIDLALVIGANDVVNPLSREKDSSLYGMPIIDVDKAQSVIVLKRSLATGFAGVSNPLFFNENTSLIFGDAKKTLQQLISELKKFQK